MPLKQEAAMDTIDLDKLFPGYPNVVEGVRKMIHLWEGDSRTMEPGKKNFSLYFRYARGKSAFRVETAIGGRVPRLVIYSGENDCRRGSPLVKGASAGDTRKLAKDFGIPENKDGKPDWLKSLSKSTPSSFYVAFAEHALKMVRGKQQTRHRVA